MAWPAILSFVVVNVVDVAVMFQPAPDPVASPTSKVCVAVATTSLPVRLTLNPVLAGAATKPSVPPAIVAVAGVATAGMPVATRTPPATSAAATSLRTGSIGGLRGQDPQDGLEQM